MWPFSTSRAWRGGEGDEGSGVRTAGVFSFLWTRKKGETISNGHTFWSENVEVFGVNSSML